MNAIDINTVMRHWEYLAPMLTQPKNTEEYDQLVADLDAVLDAGGANENHPLASLADRMGDLIAQYDDLHYTPKSNGIDALKFLMQEHGLGQSDFSDIASQGVMSEILRGKRELNIRQIRKLAERFHVAEQVFI